MSLPSKDPNSIEPYFIIWCGEGGINTGGVTDTGELQGATISTVAWTVQTGITEVTHNQQSVTIHGVVYAANTVCTIWLSGGIDGVDHELNCRITTSDSRTLDKAITISVRAKPVTILSQAEAATVLRCEQDDPNMIDLLPLVDGYIQMATGRDWSQDVRIRPEARAAARMLIVRWHEDPGGMASGSALGYGLAAILTQLEALALKLATTGTPDEPLAILSTNIDGYMAVGASFVLVFNHKMDASSTSLVTLEEVDLSPVTATNTLDATGKIMTITPAADLDPATSYVIEIDYAPDIYGQTIYREISFVTA
jgi:hypothetical protein